MRALLLACLFACDARAAVLRPYSEIVSPMVRLTDLFDTLGATPDRVLGRAPPPGEQIEVGAPQLAAIARDYDVDWRPQTGAERVIVARRGEPLPAAAVQACLQAALRAAGAPPDGEVLTPGFTPPLMAAGTSPAVEARQTSFDAQSGRFTALLAVRDGQGEAVTLRLSGVVAAMREAVALTRRLPLGAVIGAGDVQVVRVRAAVLHGQVPLSPAQAVGMAMRHDTAPGQPLTEADVAKPSLVLRGAAVHMVLQADGIALSAQGVALEAGGLGDRIRVLNPSSRATVLGEITGPGELRVAPGGTRVLASALAP